MLLKSVLFLAASAVLVESRHETRHVHSYLHRRAAADTSLTLDPSALQKGSEFNGSTEIGSGVGQALSATSDNNFINYCAGKVLTNGEQIVAGSCNGIPMGDIPAKDDMISAMIQFPLAGSATVQSDTTFNISVQVTNLVAGFFTNADATYYSAPQALQGGKVVGHTHVTVQDMGDSLNPTTAPDPTKFAFFKGINDAGNGEGLLQATVTGGLPAGNYRVCTITSAANHQPVLMPVAQRGTADDCTKFTVVGNGTTENDSADDGSKGIAAASLAAAAAALGPGVATTAVSNATSTSAQATSIITVANSTATTAISVAPFSNYTATISKGKNGGGKAKTTKTKAGNGGKVVDSSVFVSATTSVDSVATTSIAATTSVDSTTTTSVAAVATTEASSGKGSGSKSSSGKSSSGKVTGKRIITIIETFFVFEFSHGAACPAVSKSGNKYNVLGQLFDDLAAAAASSCGHQYSSCIALIGPNFTEEECISQKDTCSKAASTQKATAAAPVTITASITLPVTVTVTTGIPGSIIAVQTVAPTATSVESISAATTSEVVASAGTALPTAHFSSGASFSNGTFVARRRYR